MRLGVCIGDNAAEIRIAKESGFDYVESGFSMLADKNGEKREAFAAELKKREFTCESVNCFIPGSLPVVGPCVDEDALYAYVSRGMTNGEALGVKTVVFGSGGARAIPNGYDFAAAVRQLAVFLRQIAGPLAQEHGIRIAVEPLCDCNVINTVKEAAMLAAMADHPAVMALGDLYHMAAVHDAPENLLLLKGILWHTHIAEPTKRVYPSPTDGCDYKPFLSALEEAGCPRCSVEARCSDFAVDAPLAVKALRGA